MRIGNTSIELLKDGTFRMDGGILFGQVAKSEWERYIKPDRRNRVTLGLNAVLINTPELKILIDTGAGNKRIAEMRDDFNLNGNKLIKGLKERGLSARDIDIVVLSNLHFDHSGGCTKLDRTGTAIPMFPNAVYMMQRSSWDAAQDPNERYLDSFYEEDYEPLAERDMVRFLDERRRDHSRRNRQARARTLSREPDHFHRVRQREDSVRGRPDSNTVPHATAPHPRDGRVSE